MQVLCNIDEKFLFTGISGFDNSDVLSGRPFGGCAILWRSDLMGTVSILATDSKRVCRYGDKLHDVMRLPMVSSLKALQTYCAQCP
jgi:hypothetical protein